MAASLRAYLAVFFAAAVTVGLAYRAADRWWTSLGCFPPAPTGHFLAYCASRQFEDYEHGAYYFGLEPEAVQSLKQSDIVFFGSSRAQFALSTRAWSDFFSTRSIKPYLLGFGQAELGAFPLALIQKHRLRPKAIVILADPFFKNQATDNIRVAQIFRWRAILEFYEYVQKTAFIQIGSALCEARPTLCQSEEPIVYRSRDDGTWQTVRFKLAPRYPVKRQALTNHTAMAAAADADFAERFLSATGLPRACIVLSAPPSASVNANAYVEDLGKRLGVRVSLPWLDGLMTFDGSHLTPESAERWSAALLADIEDTISECAGRP